jgi:hypothetical protein
MAAGNTALDLFGPRGLLDTHRVPSTVRDALLALVRGMEAHPAAHLVYLKTRMYQVAFCPSAASGVPDYVTVLASSDIHYSIEYLVPEGQGPWPWAYMKGDATSTEAAVEMVEHSMRLSGAWATPSQVEGPEGPGAR